MEPLWPSKNFRPPIIIGPSSPKSNIGKMLFLKPSGGLFEAEISSDCNQNLGRRRGVRFASLNLNVVFLYFCVFSMSLSLFLELYLSLSLYLSYLSSNFYFKQKWKFKIGSLQRKKFHIRMLDFIFLPLDFTFLPLDLTFLPLDLTFSLLDFNF